MIFIRKQEKNITSERGKKLMYKRDNKTKKAFDDLKKNYGHDNVKVEMYLVAMGHNIRKYHELKMKQRQKDQENV